MGVNVSSLALNAGMFAAYFAVFGATVGVFQPPAIFKMDDVKPFYEWYFGVKLPKEKDFQSQARKVAAIELCAALSVILPQDNKTPGLVLNVLFFAYSTRGHYVVKDEILPVATIMLCCSLSALVATLVVEKE
jgi:hypothetical protein